jgi:hypothetical protein
MVFIVKVPDYDVQNISRNRMDLPVDVIEKRIIQAVESISDDVFAKEGYSLDIKIMRIS